MAPEFGPYNMLLCRPGQIASFPLNGSILKGGLVVAMDIYPYWNGSARQPIFSLRDTSQNAVSLAAFYFTATKVISMQIIVNGILTDLLNLTITSLIPLQIGNNLE